MRATAKRALPLLLLLMLLPQGGMAQAAPEMLAQANAQLQARAMQGQMAGLLDVQAESTDTRRAEMRIGDWFVHPEGFAFRVPEGFEVETKNRGKETLLVEKDKRASHRITLQITLQERVDKLTREELIKAYSSWINRFELRSFSTGTLFGVEMTRIWFVSEASPQKLVQQCLLNKDGCGYIITLTMENHLPRIEQGLSCYRTFCDTLVFAGQLEAGR